MQDLSNQQYRITEVNAAADKLIAEGHPDTDVIRSKREVCSSVFYVIDVEITACICTAGS